ncbi:uncharacterized protein LOC117181066 [Belonocnema kinseyi]|uniref:uncharacterized protein LOC117181066 n=1 Tax=Belonocnema kinseyi TaxID=2817044 RepID=UPI00143D2EB2|nr:uncharacterized protein LOC117181066 [Belonocnema kinseyi]
MLRPELMSMDKAKTTCVITSYKLTDGYNKMCRDLNLDAMENHFAKEKHALALCMEAVGGRFRCMAARIAYQDHPYTKCKSFYIKPLQAAEDEKKLLLQVYHINPLEPQSQFHPQNHVFHNNQQIPYNEWNPNGESSNNNHGNYYP